MRLPNFIIGGTNKAGTTSVFRYLSDHPEVCGSSVKETGFFVRECSGDSSKEKVKLSRYFAHCDGNAKIRVEASTSYLALGQEAIPRIREILGEPRILFILRNPIDRIYSYFNFHAGHLSIPDTVSFEEYLLLCQKYNSGEIGAEQVPFDEWHLRALAYGRYSEFLKDYLREFSVEKVKVMFYEDLKKDPKSFMKEISEYAEIEAEFYDNYGFEKANVTFSSKSQALHKFAVSINRGLESFLRQRPFLKSKLVAAYKKINMAKQGYNEMLPETRVFLKKYYSDSNRNLEKIIGRPLPGGWS